MSRKTRTHLRGKRGQAFADQIRGIPSEQILCVSLDISKYFHVVMIHNALGDIVTPLFEIDILETGFDRLCQAIDEAVLRAGTQLVLLSQEDTLLQHLRSPRSTGCLLRGGLTLTATGLPPASRQQLIRTHQRGLARLATVS